MGVVLLFCFTYVQANETSAPVSVGETKINPVGTLPKNSRGLQ